MTERALHLFVANTLRLYGVPNLIAFHPANEGKRSKFTGQFLKTMGMLPGVADFAITLPGGKQAYLELKTPKGRTEPSQLAFEALCKRNGTPYVIARTPEEATAVLYEWGALIADPLAKRSAA